MLIKKIFITFLLLFSISIYAKNNIALKELQNITQNKTSKNIILNKKNIVPEYNLQNDIQSLFTTGKLQNAEKIGAKRSIIPYTQEKPIISNVVFYGNNIIKNSILEIYLERFNIKKGSAFNQLVIDEFTKIIKDYYYNIGRFESNIQVFKQFSQNNTVNLKILFHEGITKNINNITIIGAKDFSKDKILSLFKSKDHFVWWKLINQCLYSPKKLNQDLKNLNDFYLNHGYFYFHINDKKVDFIKDTNQVNITINVSEGEKYRISKIFVKGNIFPYQQSIKKLITIHSHELYNKEKISNIIDNITKLLSDNGYINSVVKTDITVNKQNKTIVLNFYIDINKRFFVHRIHFVGNSVTQDKVLRREIKQMEGKYVNENLIELGKKALQQTKYFRNVEIIRKMYSIDSNQVDIFYRVQEQPTGTINFGLGYSKDSGISFNASLSKDNIFGSGNSFKANFVKNNHQKYSDISISYPYFTKNIKNLNTRLFYSDFEYNLNNFTNTNKKTYGLESTLGFLIGDFNKINLGFGYTHNSVNDKEKIFDAFNVNTWLIGSKFSNSTTVNDFTMNYSWTHSALEYLYFPVSGNQIYINGKNTIPGSDSNFYKFILDSQSYLPLSKKKDFIFFSHMHLGVGNVFNKEQFPFYENFHVNNTNNIRGFRANTIGPKRIYDNSNSEKCVGYLNQNKCESIDSIGGNLSFTTNLEMITPIPFIEPEYSKYFRASIFLDVGNIWDTESYFSKTTHKFSFLESDILDNIYSSVGMSLEWLSPIGPLVFSYAVPMQQERDYQLEPFQFHFGKNW